MNILENLWYGQICPCADAQCQNAEYRELEDLSARNRERLFTTLNPQQQEDLQKLEDVWSEQEQLLQCQAFVAGFRLAVQVMSASV